MFISTILRYALACVASIIIVLISGFVFGDESLITTFAFIAVVIAMIYYGIMVYVGAWNILKFKNRSPWWMCLMLIGLIGAAIIICLKNKAHYVSINTFPTYN